MEVFRRRYEAARGAGPRPGPRSWMGSVFAHFATARLGDDGDIDPLDTRRVIALGIEAALHAPIPETRFGVFRM